MTEVLHPGFHWISVPLIRLMRSVTNVYVAIFVVESHYQGPCSSAYKV